MERVRIVARQLVAAATDGQGGVYETPSAKTDGSTRPKRRMSQEEMMQAAQVFTQYMEGVDELKATGKPPPMTLFDVFMATQHETTVPARRDVRRMIEEAKEKGDMAALETLPGPWRDAKTLDEQVDLVIKQRVAYEQGDDLQWFVQLQKQYGDRGLGSNIVIPCFLNQGCGSSIQWHVGPRVIIADPADAERLSRIHVQKEGNFEGAIFDSVISTPDNGHWRNQREHLSEVFLPMSSLGAIMPTSLARAKLCAERLGAQAAGGDAVDMSNFLLHEAQAQLQLALLGAPEDLMEATNAEIRAAFMGDTSKGKVGSLGDAMRQLMELAQSDETLALPSDGCPVRGPLSRAVKTSGLGPSATYGNMLLILFAGHDTTGHTMTWLLFELARNPKIQAALHKEVDEFFHALAGRDPEYRDLSKLDLMDRCITETLRLWPAVASGTYRRLQIDDTVMGLGGKEVTLPRGTAVNIINWNRHRNRDLWGDDADIFNPMRKFSTEEIAKVGCPMAGVNPQSERFSPFAFTPRHCLGRNFAQMEMRLIMLNLLRSFDFALAPPYDAALGKVLDASTSAEGEFRGVNRITLGPMDMEQATEHSWGKRPLNALKMFARSRR